MMAVLFSLLIGALVGLLPRSASMVAAMTAFAATISLAGLAGGVDLGFLQMAAASVIACNIGLGVTVFAPLLRPATHQPF